MLQHPLDIAMALQPAGPGLFAGTTSDAYWNFAGPFGGYTAALLMKAVMGDARLLGPPVAQTVNFCAPISKGAFEIAVILQRSGKATQHWSLELRQQGIVAATASIGCANRRETFSHANATVPDVPPPANLTPSKSNSCRQRDWPRSRAPLDRESICRPPRGSIHRCQVRVRYPSTICQHQWHAEF